MSRLESGNDLNATTILVQNRPAAASTSLAEEMADTPFPLNRYITCFPVATRGEYVHPTQE